MVRVTAVCATHSGELRRLGLQLVEGVTWDQASRPLYPDVPEVLTAVRALGVRIALVSDIHFDIRASCAERGIGALIDAYVLSFEHGFQKPNKRMFQVALDTLGVEPSEALMVGDWAPTDGGAASLGIVTLILPGPTQLGPEGSTSCSVSSTRRPCRSEPSRSER